MQEWRQQQRLPAVGGPLVIFIDIHIKKTHPASVIKHWEDKNVSRNESKNANVMRMSTQFSWHWSQINSICFQEFSDRLCVVDLVSCLLA